MRASLAPLQSLPRSQPIHFPSPPPPHPHPRSYCVYLFHELPLSVQRAAAAEMARVVKPGGIVILTDSVQVGDREAYDNSIGNFGDFQVRNLSILQGRWVLLRMRVFYGWPVMCCGRHVRLVGLGSVAVGTVCFPGSWALVRVAGNCLTRTFVTVDTHMAFNKKTPCHRRSPSTATTSTRRWGPCSRRRGSSAA